MADSPMALSGNNQIDGDVMEMMAWLGMSED